MLLWQLAHICITLTHKSNNHIMKHKVQFILGVSSKGQSLLDNASYTAKVNEAKRLREDLNVANPKDFTV